jgi:CheY-like chemotaxis protein
MDQMMPKMNGVEATKLIREMPGDRGETPIVALTANAISGSEQMFLEAGFNGYLSKPVDEKALSAALYKFLPQDKIAKE